MVSLCSGCKEFDAFSPHPTHFFQRLHLPTPTPTPPRLHAEGRLSTLTVPSLKSFLASKGLHVTGKKADLIERIGNYLAK